MTFTETALKDSYLIQLKPFSDNRGIFSRLFCENEFSEAGFHKRIVQINHSFTRERGAIRGLHFQKAPHCEAKIVRCIRGKAFDVIVDIRKDSPTFLQWFGVELSPEENNALYIPEGFAHGFQALKNNTELIYFHSEFYHKESEGVLCFDDASIGIKWKLKARGLSEKDYYAPSVKELNFKGISV
jgi:dTDP-4-dehydrorhamnose 3,5-epimerase